MRRTTGVSGARRGVWIALSTSVSTRSAGAAGSGRIRPITVSWTSVAAGTWITSGTRSVGSICMVAPFVRLYLLEVPWAGETGQIRRPRRR